ncbi:hypothetical protein KXW38_008429, partial [Aspergillus fumigatus]
MGRGFDDVDLLVLDEALFLDPAMIQAAVSGMTTRPKPMVIYASSAGVAGSVQLRQLRQRMVDGDAKLAGFEWSADPELVRRQIKAGTFDPLALEHLIPSNPSLADRRPGLVTVDWCSGELGELGLAGYLRERFGLFDEDPAEAKRVIPAGAWSDRGGAVSPPDGPVAFGVAAAWPDAEHAAIAVAGRLDGELVVQVIEHHAGTSWVLPRLRELVDRHGAPVVIDPGGPAGHLVADIADEDLEPGQDVIEVLTPTMRQVGYASKDLLAAVDGDAPSLRHFDQPELNAAVAGAARRTLGELWTWQRRGDTDISPLEAVTLAAWGVSTLVDHDVPAPVAVSSSSAARPETADLARI